MVKKIIVLYFYMSIGFTCKSPPYNVRNVPMQSTKATIPEPETFFHDPSTYGVDSNGHPICFDDLRKDVWELLEDIPEFDSDGELLQVTKGVNKKLTPEKLSVLQAPFKHKLKHDPAAAELQKLFDKVKSREDTENAMATFCEMDESSVGPQRIGRYCGGNVLGQRTDKPGPWTGVLENECAAVCYLTHREESGYPPDLPTCESFHHSEGRMICEFRTKAPEPDEVATDWNPGDEIADGTRYLKFARATSVLTRYTDMECKSVKVLTPTRLRKMIEDKEHFECWPNDRKRDGWGSNTAFDGESVYEDTAFSTVIIKQDSGHPYVTKMSCAAACKDISDDEYYVFLFDKVPERIECVSVTWEESTKTCSFFQNSPPPPPQAASTHSGGHSKYDHIPIGEVTCNKNWFGDLLLDDWTEEGSLYPNVM